MTQPLSAQRNESEEPEPVSLRFRFDSETVEQFAERYASDVSRGGIFVQSRQPLAVGTRLKLDLQLLNGTPLIVGEGTVHWTREPDAAKPNTVPGMGIRFNKLSGRSQQVIDTVLSQRTGKQRTGLFSSVMPAVSIEESQKILSQNKPDPKSKLPFNVFPGRPHDPSKPSDDRELLANAGREETTPVVGVTAANLADARPGKDEAASQKTPPPAAPIAEMASGPTSASGSKRQPPALALIRPEAGAPHKEAEKAVTDSARVRRSSGSSKAAPLPAPPFTTTQEIAPSGSTPPAPVQGEPALGASQSGVPRPIGAMPSQAAAIPSVKPPMRNKLIIGAAALLAVTITVFATTRKGPVKPDAGATVAHATTTSTSPAPAGEAAPSAAAVPPATGTAPTETAPEANAGPAVEPEAPAPATSGSSNSKPSHAPDRRATKGKTVVAHRESQPASRASAPAAPVEKAPVAEAPRVEAPAPVVAPPPPPAPVAHVEPPPAPKPVHTEPPPAPKPAPVVALPAGKPAVVATTPPPVGGMAHKLRMTSIPSEAEVELDGKPIGRTPLFGVEIDVSQSHQLVVKKDGFAPFKQTISRSSEWNVRPSENTATLRISALMKKQ